MTDYAAPLDDIRFALRHAAGKGDHAALRTAAGEARQEQTDVHDARVSALRGRCSGHARA